MYEREHKSFLQKVINIPDKLKSAIAAAILFLMAQLVAFILRVIGVDLSGVILPLAAGISLALTAALKAVLERLVPESLHPIVNAILVYIAGFFAALALLRALA